MKRYQYKENTEIGEFITTVNEWWIQKMYYPKWAHHMIENGNYEITLSLCIRDFMNVYGAREI